MDIHGWSFVYVNFCFTTPFLNVFDVFGTCCFGGLMWSALALPLTSTERKLIHPQNSYQSPWHLTWKFCACQDLLLRWCPKCQHKSCGESWLTIYSRLGHAEICSILTCIDWQWFMCIGTSRFEGEIVVVGSSKHRKRTESRDLPSISWVVEAVVRANAWWQKSTILSLRRRWSTEWLRLCWCFLWFDDEDNHLWMNVNARSDSFASWKGKSTSDTTKYQGIRHAMLRCSTVQCLISLSGYWHRSREVPMLLFRQSEQHPMVCIV